MTHSRYPTNDTPAPRLHERQEEITRIAAPPDTVPCLPANCRRTLAAAAAGPARA
ncbi:MAG: hypothetical protein QM270_10885 [Bacillota bacterium]|nr:hypothetical protein [Bacillota bacterium]